jgi:putative transposase
MEKPKIPLSPGKYYHIYNHANGHENIFMNDGNYYYFLEKYQEYINPVANTFAYCLMPNHFHFLLKIKGENELKVLFEEKLAARTLGGLQALQGFYVKRITFQFSNFFNGYTQAFNIQQSRRGSLLRPNFKRKEVTTASYFRKLVHYIHYNPIHHGFVKDMRDWKYSSFDHLNSSKKSLISPKDRLKYFNSEEDYYTFHLQSISQDYLLEMECWT